MDRRKFLTGFGSIFAAPVVATPAWGGFTLPASEFATPFIPAMQVANEFFNKAIQLNDQHRALASSLKMPFSNVGKHEEIQELLLEKAQTIDSMLRVLQAEMPKLPAFVHGNEQHRLISRVMSISTRSPDGLMQLVSLREQERPSEVSLQAMPIVMLRELTAHRKVAFNHKDTKLFSETMVGNVQYVMDRVKPD